MPNWLRMLCPVKFALTSMLTANKESHVMIIGGAAVGERHIEWNFVSSSKDRIAQASADWKEGRFESVPGDDEFIPLP